MADFVQNLIEMRGGKVALDLDQKFKEVVKAVVDSGGKGEMTVKFRIVPSKMAMGGAVVEVEIEHDVKMKKPELPVGRSTFFVDKEGNLSREDPDQAAMFAEEAQK